MSQQQDSPRTQEQRESDIERKNVRGYITRTYSSERLENATDKRVIQTC